MTGMIDPMRSAHMARPALTPTGYRLKLFNVPFLFAGYFLALGCVAPPQSELTRFSYTEYHMGVDARLVVYAPNQQTAEDACRAAFARIAELDSIMSDYRRDSELNRLCARSG